MKTALLTFNSTPFGVDLEIIEYIKTHFNKVGLELHAVLGYPSVSESDLLDYFKGLKADFDNVIILDGFNVDIDVASLVSVALNKDLVENNLIKTYVLDYLETHSGNFLESYALCPNGAIVIPNIYGIMQGYYLEDKNFSVIVLPNSLVELKSTLNEYAIPYLLTKKVDLKNSKTYKLFDTTYFVENKVKELLDKYNYDVKVELVKENGDITLTVKELDEYKIFCNFCFDIENKLTEYLYADELIGLQNKLVYLLNLNNFVISTAESFTGGRVASAIVSVPNASKNFAEGICAYSNLSKMKRLGVSKDTLNIYGAVSQETAKEMVKGLLNDADYGISTTGIAGPKSDNTNKPVGLCYVAFGNSDEIVVLELNLKGDREEITETGKNNALFLAIKQLEIFCEGK